MFEDFKNEIRRHNGEKAESSALPPEVVAKLKSQGLDPETVTMKQLFPEVLDEDGNDISLMSGAEWEIMITYAKTRKYLLEKYPQSQEEARNTMDYSKTQGIISHPLYFMNSKSRRLTVPFSISALIRGTCASIALTKARTVLQTTA